jgi:hypothetical protein
MATDADALFSRTTQRLISVLFVEDARAGLSFAEVLRRTQGGSGAIHRELKKFLEAGFLVAKESGARRAFAANRSHPLYPEIRGIAEKLGSKSRKPLEPVIARTFAKRYLWWVDPSDAVNDQIRLVAQVMDLGAFEDVRHLEKELGNDYLREVVRQAKPGYFSERSWTFWHYRLDLARPGKVPELPARRFD